MIPHVLFKHSHLFLNFNYNFDVSVYHMCAVPTEAVRVSQIHVELELQAVVRYHVGAGLSGTASTALNC